VAEKAVVEAMTTNESFFFRDNKPFDQFRSIVLPNLLKARASKKSFRIWSAACSSGQEPYSLAMILKEEAAKLSGWRVEIVGTDISSDILQKARTGAYSQFEVQRGMPMTLLVKYFKKKDENWVIDPALQSMVTFKEWNLLGDVRALGHFDVVFCRNVLIYFDQPTKSKVLQGISQVMADDAVLYLGGAETVLGISDHFKPVPGQRGIYAVSKGNGPSLGAPPA
jgi:chemotaxis protein methyltransferase CheR